MALSWNPEVFIDFIAVFILLICSIITHTSPRTKKIKSLIFIRLAMFSLCLFYLFEGISILYLNLIITRTYSLFFPSKLISGKKKPLLLTASYENIPPDVQEKLKWIFTNERELELMKKEISEFSEEEILHFIQFYDEMKEKLKFIEKENIDKKLIK